MASKQAVVAGASALRRWAHRASKYCRYGLYHDDVLYEYPHVQEALRRIPQSTMDERNFRIMRALHLSMKKIYLPKEEWISYEDDHEKGRYLQQYITEVLQEMKEKEEWSKK